MKLMTLVSGDAIGGHKTVPLHLIAWELESEFGPNERQMDAYEKARELFSG